MNASLQSAAAVLRFQDRPDDPEKKLKVLERRCQRERAARQQAETFLEAKSLELYEANQELKKMNEGLEKTVSERTNDLRTALQNIKDAKKRTEHLALHDPLTSLPNRRFLRNHLDELFAIAKAEDASIAILHIDLDRFKLINDTLGHAAGDHVLAEVSKILKDVTSKDDFIARIGGDEFVVVTKFQDDNSYVAELATRIPERVAEPIDFNGRPLRIGASVGYCFDKASQTAPDKLLISSDIALYQAKDLGRGVSQEFTSELEVQMSEKKQLADEILEALERDEFIPFYQPKICAATNAIEGVEALVRWNHPTRGLMFPDTFLDVASDIGVLAKVDDMMLRHASADFRKWEEMGLKVPRFTVNMSLGRLMDEDLLKRLDQLNLPPGKVGFEVVESIFFDNPDDSTMQRINDLKERQIDIEIDDFGTGHASIIGVVKLQPSALKIDRQLIMDIVDSPIQERLVKAIVEIGRSLELSVVAEGIESQDHADICTRLGCDVLQGYFFGKPMPCEDLEKFCETFQAK